ncbi:PHB depolymerase family esterase [Dactylosporangium sp. AC04546]|uniref:alpha/beta hydrolase family esterase n=1 Tax=Dactylosporangium sp. AC04546 TaxID=2862460 RepID=UPI001EDF24D1|nr:PHB depolymerase family esterase [Dactylosporangium sp. AC04546]WVK84994.1 PHB depolymerase family esterase [Dactylosporangium sp. AC04546]
MKRGLTALVALLLAACSTATPVDQSSPGPQPGNHRIKVTVGDTEREYLLHVPERWKPSSAAPAVIALHYRPGNAQAMQKLTGFDARADRDTILVAYPEGVGGQFNAFGCCGMQDDVAFVKVVAAQLVADWKADPRRLFVAGVSNGGDLAFRAAVEASGTFAAVGVVSGGFYGTRTEAADYKPASRVDVITLIGADDPQADTFRQGIAVWRERLGCTPAANSQKDSTLTRCPDGSRADSYVVKGGGHAWFGATTGELADTKTTTNASDVLWTFFKERTPQ